MYLCVGLSFIKCFIKCSMSLIWILIVCSSSFFFCFFAWWKKNVLRLHPLVIHIQEKLKIVFVVTTLVARGILGVASSVKSWWWLYQKIVFSLSSFLEKSSLSFSLLLYFQLFAENRCNFAGHECPRYAWVGQRTFFAWWTVDFSTRSLKDRRLFEISWWWIILRWLSNDVTAKKKSFCMKLFELIYILSNISDNIYESIAMTSWTLQRPSLTCRLMLSRLHGKQNLWWATDGHWTKWVSSNRSWQIVPAS